MLITANPRIIAFENHWATSKGVLTFKPSRTISKQAITGNDTNEAWFNNLETEIEIHKEQPFLMASIRMNVTWKNSVTFFIQN
jgi:hydroxymethylglutaryl-CoA synthase